MKSYEEHAGDVSVGRIPVIVQTSSDFQLDVLEKLGRLEVKMDMLMGNGQPGRMRLAEDRLIALERDDAKRNVYDRIVIGAIALVASALIALHDHFVLR
ncbi:MAG: hypothetical protein WBQ72_18815 [Terriglobales bacterium]|jgi:hypothetical protein